MKIQFVLIAAALDLILGDPYSFPHPVKGMGHLIDLEEKLIRRFANSSVQLKVGGLLMVLLNSIIGFGLPFLILRLLPEKGKYIFSVYAVYSCISPRMLHYEAFQVKKALSRSIEEGRDRLQYIVGRDTRELTEEEIISATVETVAENTSDGVIAPLFFIGILGVPGGFLYKFINTMDSMVGYNNDKYGDLGYYPAIVDDIFNFIPARITAVLMIIAGIFFGRGKDAYRTVKRDHGKHLSPNAGYPESAVAGILGIQLGGGHHYFGKYVEKPTIGERSRPISPGDIEKAVKIMYLTEIFSVLLLTVFLQHNSIF